MQAMGETNVSFGPIKIGTQWMLNITVVNFRPFKTCF